MIRITTDKAINEKIAEIMNREEERRFANQRAWELEKRISRLEARVRQLDGKGSSDECTNEGTKNVPICGF